MSPSHQPPATLRYLKARLRPLFSPQVLLTIGLLLMIGGFAGTYFANLDQLTSNEEQQKPVANKSDETENNQANSTLTPEERAIAADIDSSPVLQKEMANASSLELAPETETQSLFDQFMKQKGDNNTGNSSNPQTTQPTPSQPGIAYNPFAINLSDSNPGGGNNNTPAVTNPLLPDLSRINNSSNSVTTNYQNTSALQKAFDRANGITLNSTGSSDSALQTALDRYQSSGSSINTTSGVNTQTNQTQTNINLLAQPNQINTLTGTTQSVTGLPVQGSIPLSQYSVPAAGTTSNPANSYTYLTQPQTPVQLNIPVNSYVAPVTGTSLPSTTTGGVTNSGYNSNYVNGVSPAATQVPTTTQPFSVPNNIPGRNIGGGQINTFSNP